MSLVNHRNTCRGCGSLNLVPILDLGDVPLAGGFLTEKDIPRERKFPLKIYYCRDCGLVQVLDVIDPSKLFKEYFYVSSVIKSLSEHFQRYSDYLLEKYLNKKDSKILEFGCNDGVLLQYFKDCKNVRAFGVDPSENVTKIAKDKGLEVYTSYFNKDISRKLKKNIGKVDVVTGSNVFAHVDDIQEIIDAAKIILKNDGVFIVEVHYLKDLIEKNQYDTTYHEHLCYYSVTALHNIFKKSKMKLIDIDHLEMHGGGIRVTAVKESSIRPVCSSVQDFIENEKSINMDSLIKFGESCKKHKKDLLKLMSSLKSEGARIVGYGAPGRGTILLNYCGIDEKYLDYIVDISPLRAGKLMPGVHIPIYGLEKARDNPPDYFFVLAWNYYESIRSQEEDLIKKGVKFILPLPQIIIE